MSKKLLLKYLLEKDVEVDTMSPSFVNGQLKCKMRRERINASMVRIKRIMHQPNADLADAEIPGTLDGSYPESRRKKRKGMVVDDVDWEDLIIETLVLHQVKEEEIEKGHYNTLLDLHVNQTNVDAIMLEIDGTPNKSKLGANAILGVSLSVCRAGAGAKGVPLYRHIQEISRTKELVMPVPTFNVINGGNHVGNNMAMQEFMILPVGAT
ncbi:hypothetical protein JHK87_010191 [Glycine soja]|nr:hypothetical protein JHK87_010191 [Glycine soja]